MCTLLLKPSPSRALCGASAARAATFIVSLLLAAAQAAGAEAVVAVGMTVDDMDRSLAFYTDVLGFRKESDVEVSGEAYEHLQGVFGAAMRVCRLRLGEEELELTDYLAPEGRPVPAGSRSNDLWFQHVAIVTPDMERAYRHLRARKVRHASTGPQRLPDWNQSAGGIEAFYFKDPDGHVLEIIRFPPGKGQARWQRPTGDLFLGIDHTAIVVADTEASLAFYRSLGMSIAGESENWGTEQEHLNNVFGARLRITALRFAGDDPGPGVELLEYLAPRDGRPYPDDARPNDLLHWQTTILATDPGTSAPPGAAWISPGAVRLPRADLGFAEGLLMRDPDGHAVRLVNAWNAVTN